MMGIKVCSESVWVWGVRRQVAGSGPEFTPALTHRPGHQLILRHLTTHTLRPRVAVEVYFSGLRRHKYLKITTGCSFRTKIIKYVLNVLSVLCSQIVIGWAKRTFIKILSCEYLRILWLYNPRFGPDGLFNMLLLAMSFIFLSLNCIGLKVHQINVRFHILYFSSLVGLL